MKVAKIVVGVVVGMTFASPVGRAIADDQGPQGRPIDAHTRPVPDRLVTRRTRRGISREVELVADDPEHETGEAAQQSHLSAVAYRQDVARSGIWYRGYRRKSRSEGSKIRAG